MKKLIDFLLVSTILGLTVFVVTPKQDRLVKVAQESMDKSVMITVIYNAQDDKGKWQKLPIRGAGVFITENGYILTVKHLFEYDNLKFDPAITLELSDGGLITAEFIAKSKKSDLALLKQSFFKKVEYAKLADPRTLRVGQEVIAVGNPLGFDFSVTNGIISALNRDLPKAYNVTQSNCTINPGNSGGPLFNLKGELIGINSFVLSPIPIFPIFTGLGFSVQPGQILEFLVFSRNKISPHIKYKWLHTWIEYVGRL